MGIFSVFYSIKEESHLRGFSVFFLMDKLQFKWFSIVEHKGVFFFLLFAIARNVAINMYG